MKYTDKKNDGALPSDDTSTEKKTAVGSEIRQNMLKKRKIEKKEHVSAKERYDFNTADKSETAKNAAELKEQLKRNIAQGNYSEKKENHKKTESFPKNESFQKIESDKKVGFEKYDDYKNNLSKIENYYDYKAAKASFTYQKKIYRIKKTSKANQKIDKSMHTLRELAQTGKDVIRPVQQGNVVGIATIPAAVYLKKRLRKTALGRASVKSTDIAKDSFNSVNSANDLSTAMYASSDTFVKETGKGIVSELTRDLIDRHSKNKYMKYDSNAPIKAEKYFSKQTEKIEQSRNIAKEMQFEALKSGSDPNMSQKIERFNNKNVKKKIDKMKKKSDKLEKKNKKLTLSNAANSVSNVAKKKVKKKLALFAVAGAAPIILSFSVIVVIVMLLYEITHPFDYLSIKGEDETGNTVYTQESMNERDVVTHYHEIMDKEVKKINDEINSILGTASEHENTGVIDPEKYAEYEQQQAAYDAYMEFLNVPYEEYVRNHYYNPQSPDYMNPDSLSPPPAASQPDPNFDYYYSAGELSERGMQRGPIFEGFKWTEESTGTQVPYGQLYDETLAAIPTNNVKHDMEEFESLNDDYVGNFYESLGFWQFTNYGETPVPCPYGGNCCSYTEPYTITDDKGNPVGQGTRTVEYCPGHYVILLELIYEFDMDKTLDEVLQFDDENKDMYDDILKDIKAY